MSYYDVIIYSYVIFSVSIIPGPSMMLAFKEGAAYNLIGTIPAALGNMVASLSQAAIAFLAFHSIASVSPQAQSIIQALGAVFICYIGYVFIRNGRHMQISDAGSVVRQALVYRRFLTGFGIAFFNPKAIMFFIALFPQFTSDININSLSEMLKIFLPVGLVALLCFMTYGMMGQSSRKIFDDKKVFGVVIPLIGALMIVTTGFVTARHFFLAT